MKYAVFKEDKQISKTYPFKLQAIIYAIESGYVVSGRYSLCLVDGYSIRRVK